MLLLLELGTKGIGSGSGSGSRGEMAGGRTRPEMPAPMITTAAELYSLLPTGTCGQGLSPVTVVIVAAAVWKVWLRGGGRGWVALRFFPGVEQNEHETQSQSEYCRGK